MMNTIRKMIRRSGALLLAAVLLITAVPYVAGAESVRAFVSTDSMVVYMDSALSVPIGTLGKYTMLDIVSVDGTIATVQSGKNVGYAGIDNLTTVESVAKPATINTRAYVRVKPSTKAAGKIAPKGTKVSVIAVVNDWALIEKEGVTGYIVTKYLTLSEVLPTAVPTPKPTVAVTAAKFTAYVVTDTMPVYMDADTSSATLATLKYGQSVTVTGYNTSWARLSNGTIQGYAPVASLSRTAPKKTAAPTATPSGTAVTAIKTVKVYAKASTTATVLGTLKTGTQVTRVAVQGSWAYIGMNGVYGFCSAAALSDGTATPAPTQTAGQKATVVNAVKVYAKADTSSKVLGSLSTGTKVNLIAVNGKWAYIERNGEYGFCNAAALLRGDAAPTATPAPTQPVEIPAVAIVDTKVYASADTGSSLLGTLKTGRTVIVRAIQGNWAYIDLSGHYGYCLLSGLSKLGATATVTPDPMSGYTAGGFDATVVTTNAKFYASASTSSKSVSIPLGTSVEVSAYSANWAYVTAKGVNGFMQIDALNRTEVKALAKGASGTDVSTLTKSLLSMGYLDSAVTTSYDDYVVSAVQRFQTACGMTVTGTADVNTLRVLYSGKAPSSPILSMTLTSGNNSAEVKRLQIRLYSLKYFTKASSVDGEYGAMTTSAIRLFQAANGLEVTGHANSLTIRKLYSLTAAALPSGQTAPDANPVVVAGNQQNNSTSISSTLASTTSTYSDKYTARQKLEYVIYLAQNQLGKPYVYGANGTSSYDCTGFTCYCFKKIGISLPRTAQNQGYSTTYTKINKVSDLVRGDLVYFNTISDNDLSDHAGIYLGAGFFIHASSGQHKVVISTLTSGYYNRVFSWGRRVFD